MGNGMAHSDGQREIMGMLRQSVRESLPEVEEIQDQELKRQVVEAWALALAETEYESLDDIPCSPVPEAVEYATKTQADHLRGTARLAVAIADAIEATMGPLGVNRRALADVPRIAVSRSRVGGSHPPPGRRAVWWTQPARAHAVDR